MHIRDFPTEACMNNVIDDSQPNISQCVHLCDMLMQELQSLNTEWKKTVDNITDRKVYLEKVLVS